MRTGRASIVASPILIGAVTMLVIIVTVFLAYNANQGLPFVPTYGVSAELPSAARLVDGNEVRIGGARVGAITSITPGRDQGRSTAVVAMELDKAVEPLASDTTAVVRTRSALGLKYLELIPGNDGEPLAAGDTIGLANAGNVVEFDDLVNTFDQGTRDDSRDVLVGFGDALAGRGESVNETIGELPRLTDSLNAVAGVLSDPAARLSDLFPALGETAREVAPVARENAAVFTHAADTFGAIGADPQALRRTIEETPRTFEAAIAGFPTQRTFLTKLADVSSRLRPAVDRLPGELPPVNALLAAGRQALPATVPLSERLEDVLDSLRSLVRNPSTGLALEDARFALTGLRDPLLRITPYNTVCNYANYTFTALSNVFSEPIDNGTSVRVLGELDNANQENRFSQFGTARPADVVHGDPYDDHANPNGAEVRPHIVLGPPAVAANGKADCLGGQFGYIRGPLGPLRYGANEDGGRNGVIADDYPGLAGPTFTGVPSLKKVDAGDPNSIRSAP